jgi:hypothetical protein
LACLFLTLGSFRLLSANISNHIKFTEVAKLLSDSEL